MGLAIRTVRAIGRRMGLEIRRARSDQWLRDLQIRTVIDVGANVGQFATVARRLFPQSQIYCYEPLENCYEVLVRRFRRDGRFHARQLALGPTQSSRVFHRNAFAPSSSLLEMEDLHPSLFPATARSTEVAVEVRPLDEVLQADDLEAEILVKLDVQGYEDRVLEGATAVLARARIVILEVLFVALYREQAEFGTLHDHLYGLGYRFSGIMDQQMRRSDGAPLWADVVFIRR